MRLAWQRHPGSLSPSSGPGAGKAASRDKGAAAVLGYAAGVPEAHRGVPGIGSLSHTHACMHTHTRTNDTLPGHAPAFCRGEAGILPFGVSLLPISLPILIGLFRAALRQPCCFTSTRGPVAGSQARILGLWAEIPSGHTELLPSMPGQSSPLVRWAGDICPWHAGNSAHSSSCGGEWGLSPRK